MQTLHVRGVPDELYESLRCSAKRRGSSIAKETIRVLGRALRAENAGVTELLDEIERTRPAVRARGIAAAELIREDRDAR